MAKAAIGCTKPAPGVIATKPATAPEIPPRTLGLPLRVHSAPVHPKAAAAAANWVATKALLARLPAANALSRVNSKPSIPQPAGADETQHHAVRRRTGT